jgi:glycosyltransferase involved in cell wall biosynthesis
MRVLHVHSGNLYGGVETFLATLGRCRQLAPSMETIVALCFDGPIGAELRAAGVPTPLLGEVRLRRPDTVWRARRVLALLMEHERFDVAVCHQSWPLAIFGSVVKTAGVPLVSWIHMAQSGRHLLDRLASRVEPDWIIYNSRYTASRHRAPHGHGDIVYLPVLGATGAVPRRTDATATRQALDTRPDDTVVVQVGRLEPFKGKAVCLDALGKLRERSGWVCWQVGGAQRPAEIRYAASLREQAERLGIAGRVRFLGQRPDVSRLLAAADIYCQPNTEPEAFGLTLIEALASGLPVVTSSVGGALEIVDDTCGMLLPPRDAGALASALDRLLGDRRERDRLGLAGPARARALCDPATQMFRIAEVLEGVSCRVR